MDHLVSVYCNEIECKGYSRTVIVYLKDRDSNFANIESARVRKENKVYKFTPYYETQVHVLT